MYVGGRIFWMEEIWRRECLFIFDLKMLSIAANFSNKQQTT
jgi:hypothetical protein